MWVVSHDMNLSAYPFLPILFLLLPFLPILFPQIGFEELFGRISGIRAHVNDLINSSKRTLSKLLIRNVDGTLSGGEWLTGCGRLVAVDAEHIKRRKWGPALFEERIHMVKVFIFTCFMAG